MSLKLEPIIKAFFGLDKDSACFVDKKTGEVVVVSAAAPDPKKVLLLKEKLADGSLIQLPKYPPKENYNDMENFVKTLKDIKLAQKLKEALESGGASSKFFRDALSSPKHRLEKEKWEQFKKDKIKIHILNFLKSNGIKAV